MRFYRPAAAVTSREVVKSRHYGYQPVTAVETFDVRGHASALLVYGNGKAELFEAGQPVTVQNYL